MRTTWSALAVAVGCLVARSASAQSFDIGIGYGHLSVAPCDLWSGLSGRGVVLQATVHPDRRFSPDFLVTYRRGTGSIDPRLFAYAASFTGGDSTRTEIGYAFVIRQRIEQSVTKHAFGFVTYGVLGWTIHEQISAITVVYRPQQISCTGCICLSCSSAPKSSTTPARSLHEHVGLGAVLAGAGFQTDVIAHTALRFEAQLAMLPLPPPVFGLRASVTAVIRVGRTR